MKKFLPIILIICVTLSFSGCFNQKETETSNSTQTIEKDFDDCVDGATASIIFYNDKQKEYWLDNKTGTETYYSPCSTFKIISTILGLENSIITDENSKMQYSGYNYPLDSWNQNLTLEQAFKSSCVWYFKQIIDKIGQDSVKDFLNKLDYGNCDVSEWDGSGLNPTSDTNGFWIESSLKITPKEQVDILCKIFEGKTKISAENISIAKKIMLLSSDKDYLLYGKTGSGVNNSWFVGFFEEENERWYFAVHLEDKQNVSGKDARDVAIRVIEKYFKNY